MHTPQEIARAFVIEAEVDYRIAQLLSGTEYHSRTIYFAQQAVEKIVKGCLALKNIFTTDHNLTSLFRAVYRAEFSDVDGLGKGIDSLERHGARVRFPLFQRPDLPVWIPSEGYREEEAERAMQTCRYVFGTLKAYIDRAPAAGPASGPGS